MALNILKYNNLMPLHFKGLSITPRPSTCMGRQASTSCQ